MGGGSLKRCIFLYKSCKLLENNVAQTNEIVCNYNGAGRPTKPNLKHLLIVSTILGVLLAAQTVATYAFMVLVTFRNYNIPLIIPTGESADTSVSHLSLVACARTRG